MSINLLQHYASGQRNFSKQDFHAQNFSEENLAEIDLAQATLAQVDFSNANLRGANLAGANLQQANLTGANLVGANLCGANLRRSNLTGAHLQDANLTDVAWSGAIMPDGTLYAASAARSPQSDAPTPEVIAARLEQARGPAMITEKPALPTLARSYSAEIQDLPGSLVTLLFISYLGSGIVLSRLSAGSAISAWFVLVFVSLLWVLKAEWSVMVPIATALVMMNAMGGSMIISVFSLLTALSLTVGLKWMGWGWRETFRSMTFFTVLMAVFLSLYANAPLLFVIAVATNIVGFMLPDHLTQLRYPKSRIILYMTTIVIAGLIVGAILGRFV